MGLNVQEIIDLGGANVLIAGVNVGHTDENGTKVTVKSTIIEAMAAKFGNVPVRKFINGQRVEVEFTLLQTSGVALGNLAAVLPGATLVTATGGAQKLTFGKIAGTALAAVSLRLQSFITSQTPGFDFNLVKATAIGDFEVTYDGKDVQKWKCKFEALIDEAGGSDGSFLATFGDPAVTQDVTAPTVTTVVPADAAAAVSVATLVTWTFSEELDGNSVNDAENDNVILMKDPTGSGATGLRVAGTAVLTNAGAGTTIVFTPAAPLAAATKYIAILNAVKDKAGNLLASGLYATEFTTA